MTVTKYGPRPRPRGAETGTIRGTAVAEGGTDPCCIRTLAIRG